MKMPVDFEVAKAQRLALFKRHQKVLESQQSAATGR